MPQSGQRRQPTSGSRECREKLTCIHNEGLLTDNHLGKVSLILLTPDTQMQSRHLHLAILLAATFWLVIAGVSIPTSLIAIAIFVGIGIFGHRILLICISSSVVALRSPLWALGPGLTVGLTVLFVIRSFFSKQNFVVIVIGAIVTCSVLVISQVMSRQKRNDSGRAVDALSILNSVVYRSIFLMGIPLSTIWPWILPVELVAGILVFMPRNYSNFAISTKAFNFVSIPMIALGFVLSRQIQSELWWMGADDNQWFEALSHSLVEWGPQENTIHLASRGISSLSYHHLAYFLSGIIDFGASEETYLVLTRVTPVLVASTLISSLLLLTQISRSRYSDFEILDSRRIIAITYVLLLVTTVPLSNFLGMAALISTLLVVDQVGTSRCFFKTFLIILIALSGVALSKAPYTYVAVWIVLVYTFSGQTRNWQVLVSGLISSCSLFYIFSFSEASSDYRFQFFSPNSVGELAVGSGSKLLALLSILAPVSIGFSALLATSKKALRLRVLNFTYVSLGVMTAAILSRIVVGARVESIRYLWEPGVLFSSLSVGLVLIDSSREYLRAKTHFQFAMTILVFLMSLLAIPKIVPSLDSGSLTAKLLRLVRDYHFPQLIFLMTGLAILILSTVYGEYFGKTNTIRLMRYFAIWGSVLVPLGIGVAIANRVPGYVESIRETRLGVQDLVRLEYLGDPELRELADFLLNNNNDDDLIAVTLCDSRIDDCESNYSLAAYSKQRFLSLGGTFVTYWLQSNPKLNDYYFSAEIVTRNPSEVISELRDRQIGLLVIDKRLADQDWISTVIEKTSNMMFENKRFVLTRID